MIAEMSLPTSWVVVTLMFGAPFPAKVIDGVSLKTKSACILYMRHRYGDGLIETHKLACVQNQSIDDWVPRHLKRLED